MKAALNANASGDTSGVQAVAECVPKLHNAPCNALRKQIELCVRDSVPFNGEAEKSVVCAVMLAEVIRNAGKDKHPSVHLEQVTIKGSLDLRLAECASLVLTGCKVLGDLILTQALATGVCIKGGSVSGDIEARELSCKMGITFSEMKVTGSIDVTNALVDGDFTCSGTHLDGGLVADGIKCEGNVLLGVSSQRCFIARKGVRLVGARIEGALDARQSQLDAAAGPQSVYMTESNASPACWKDVLYTREASASEDAAFCADSLRCDGSVILDGAHFIGDVRLLNAKLQAQLLVRNVRISGSIWCNAAECRDIAIFDHVTFSDPDSPASDSEPRSARGLALSGVSVGGRLQVTHSNPGWVSLSAAHVAHFVDDLGSRPPASRLAISGFTYERLTDTAYWSDGVEENEFKARLEWLSLQKSRIDGRPLTEEDKKARVLKEWFRGSEYGFLPAPHTNFADFLDRRGRPHLATRVRIERDSLRARQKDRGFWGTAWWMVLAITVEYGYRPQRALVGLALMPMVYRLLQIIIHWNLLERLKAWNPEYLAISYWEAMKTVLPVPDHFPIHDGPGTLVAFMTLVLASVGGAGLLNLLGKK